MERAKSEVVTKDLECYTKKCGHYPVGHEAPSRLLSMVEKRLEQQVRSDIWQCCVK